MKYHLLLTLEFSLISFSALANIRPLHTYPIQVQLAELEKVLMEKSVCMQCIRTTIKSNIAYDI